MTDTPGRPHRIDLHAHYLAPLYREASNPQDDG